MGLFSKIANLFGVSKPASQPVEVNWIGGQTADGKRARFTLLRKESDAGGGKRNIALYGKEGDLTPHVGFYYNLALSPTSPPTFLKMSVKIGE